MDRRTVAPSHFIPAVVDLAAVGPTKVVNASGKAISIWQLWIYNVAAQSIQFFASGRPLTGPLTGFPANSAISLPFTGAPHFELSTGEDFEIVTGAGTQLSGFINYKVEQ